MNTKLQGTPVCHRTLMGCVCTNCLYSAEDAEYDLRNGQVFTFITDKYICDDPGCDYEDSLAGLELSCPDEIVEAYEDEDWYNYQCGTFDELVDYILSYSPLNFHSRGDRQ